MLKKALISDMFLLMKQNSTIILQYYVRNFKYTRFPIFQYLSLSLKENFIRMRFKQEIK